MRIERRLWLGGPAAALDLRVVAYDLSPRERVEVSCQIRPLHRDGTLIPARRHTWGSDGGTHTVVGMADARGAIVLDLPTFAFDGSCEGVDLALSGLRPAPWMDNLSVWYRTRMTALGEMYDVYQLGG